MSLLTRLLGRRKGDPYSEGIALFEQGRFADASELLRLASRKSGSGSSSLASFYLRQCLVNEGVRRIGESDPAGAEPWLAEASATWDHFPDLAYQHALALALCERVAHDLEDLLHRQLDVPVRALGGCPGRS